MEAESPSRLVLIMTRTRFNSHRYPGACHFMTIYVSYTHTHIYMCIYLQTYLYVHKLWYPIWHESLLGCGSRLRWMDCPAAVVCWTCWAYGRSNCTWLCRLSRVTEPTVLRYSHSTCLCCFDRTQAYCSQLHTISFETVHRLRASVSCLRFTGPGPPHHDVWREHWRKTTRTHLCG